MKYQCEVIQDLLPLYHDKVCSPASGQMVEEHMKECGICREIAEKLDNTAYDCEFQEEKKNVIGKYAKEMKRKTVVVGAVMAGVLLIPVLVCLICNLAIGHSLDWFFIVLTALLVVASVTVVPLVAERYKGLLTLGGFTASCLLLLLTCNIYAGGNWFAIAATAVILGLSVVFMPYILTQIPLPDVLRRQKALLCMLADTLFLFGMLTAIGFWAGGQGYWRNAFSITGICAALVWIIFIIIRYLKTGGFVKAGLCTIIIGVFSAFINDIIGWILREESQSSIFNADFLNWTDWRTINGNIWVIVLAASVAAGIICILYGCLHTGRKESST